MIGVSWAIANAGTIALVATGVSLAAMGASMIAANNGHMKAAKVFGGIAKVAGIVATVFGGIDVATGFIEAMKAGATNAALKGGAITTEKLAEQGSKDALWQSLQQVNYLEEIGHISSKTVNMEINAIGTTVSGGVSETMMAGFVGMAVEHPRFSAALLDFTSGIGVTAAGVASGNPVAAFYGMTQTSLSFAEMFSTFGGGPSVPGIFGIMGKAVGGKGAEIIGGLADAFVPGGASGAKAFGGALGKVIDGVDTINGLRNQAQEVYGALKIVVTEGVR